jgi:hypothetical protein
MQSKVLVSKALLKQCSIQVVPDCACIDWYSHCRYAATDMKEINFVKGNVTCRPFASSKACTTQNERNVH